MQESPHALPALHTLQHSERGMHDRFAAAAEGASDATKITKRTASFAILSVSHTCSCQRKVSIPAAPPNLSWRGVGAPSTNGG